MKKKSLLAVDFDKLLVRIGQQSRRMEKALLGALLVNPKLMDYATVLPDDFTDKFYKQVYEEMIYWYQKEQNFDPLMINKRLDKKVDCEVMVALAKIMDGVPKSDNIKHYNDLVKEYGRRRSFVAGIHGMYDAILRDEELEDVRNMNDKLITEVFETEDLTGDDLIFADIQIDNYYEHLRKYEQNAIKTGFPSIDKAFGGILGGEVVTILAMPRVGKSAFKQNIIAYMMKKYSWGILDFELEMPQIQFTERQLQLDNELERSDVMQSAKASDNRVKIADYLVKYKNLVVVDKPVSMNDIRKLIKRANSIRKTKPIKVVFIDHLLYVKAPGGETEKITEIYPEFKQIAKQFNVAIFIIHHSHRMGDDDGYKPLKLTSGRGSGAIENNSDFVIGMFREELEPDLDIEKQALVQDTLTIQILKNRRGYCGMFDNFVFDKPRMIIREIKDE